LSRAKNISTEEIVMVLPMKIQHDGFMETKSARFFPLPVKRAVTIRGVTGILLPAAIILLGILAKTDPASAQNWQMTSALSNRWCSLVCSADGRKLFAAASGDPFIYTSTNWGSSWFVTGAPSNTWTSVACSADGVKVAASVAVIYNPAGGTAHSGPIYTSTDSGKNWLATSAPSNQWSCVACSADGSTIIAAAAYNNSNGAGGLIFISTNSGFSWSLTSAPTNIWKAVASSADGRKFVAGGIGIFISTNAGAAWISNSISASGAWDSVAISADGSTMLGIRSSAVCTSTNFGNTWASNTLPNIGFGAVAASADGGTLMASKGHLYTSIDSGATWVQATVPSQTFSWGSSCVTLSADGNKLFLALGSDDFGHPNSIYSCYLTPNPRLLFTASRFNVALSWVVPSTNFGIQWTSNLTTKNWVNVPATPALDLTNLKYRVILSLPGSNGFYRLATP
jgi:hypothetical protein